MMSLRWTTVLVAASLLGSCTWFKKKAPPPVVVAAPPPAPPADPAPATITSPPEIQPDRSTVATTPPPSIGTPAPPAKPPAQRTQAKKTVPARRSGSRPSPSTGSLPGPEEPEPAAGTEPSAATVPQLTEILTPSQQKRYNRSIDTSLKRAEESLEKVKNRQLTADQSATAKRVQAFVRQAQEARTSDLGTARSLAQRAEILAADLARSVR